MDKHTGKVIEYKRRATYLALEEVNHTWCVDEVKATKEMWKEGIGYISMAKYLKRPEEDVKVLLLDLDLQGKLPFRKGGIHGTY